MRSRSKCRTYDPVVTDVTAIGESVDAIDQLAMFFADGGFAIVGPYAAEVWPSHLRTSGMGSAYGFGGIGKILTRDAYDSFYTQGNAAQQFSGGRYRPLSIITFAIEQQLFGSTAKDKPASDLATI